MTLQMFQQWLSNNSTYLIVGVIFIIMVGIFIIIYLTADITEQSTNKKKLKGKKCVS